MNRDPHDSLPDLEPADWRLTRTLFDRLLDADESDRVALLAPYAEDDPVRRAAERLVRALADVGGFMDTDDAEGAANEAAPAELPSDVISGYDLRERLGEGAFGVVYRARQLEPIERDVAIKLLRPGFVSPQVLSRFWGEHGYLAQVDHPDVVKVLDAGTTADGRSYIVMELIRGVPITSFASERGLSIDDRMRLMVRVCRAVQAVHQSAIIHRDLKPTNILVSEDDGSPRPRVIDFGVATAIDAAERSGWTCIGQPIGTPRYASPEQSSSGAAIGTRADVYALGVVLCELLTGSRPREDALGVASRQARPPSQLARLESEARKFRGDLDRIVLKAVSWDAELRYGSAAELADDLERFLAGLPVRATPPGTV
ncbi:MAG: serine/threonine protein kinase, partial [Phycisphaerales bacterium]|nr:serine/threonine protein kinase [Phycisphaerales bacterium]